MTDWKPIRCPKCHHRGVILTEIWEATLELIQREDGTLVQPLFNLDPGNPTGEIRAQCEGCDHKWRLRGWRQFPTGDIEEEKV